MHVSSTGMMYDAALFMFGLVTLVVQIRASILELEEDFCFLCSFYYHRQTYCPGLYFFSLFFSPFAGSLSLQLSYH